MRSSLSHALSGSIVALVAVAIVGCSHDTLGSGMQDLDVVYTPSPSGAGRWDSASMKLLTLRVVPTEPEAGPIFSSPTGTSALLFRFDEFSVDLTRTSVEAFARIGLATGTYRVWLIEFTPPLLQDLDTPADPSTCIEGFTLLSRNSAPGIPVKFTFNEPTALTFTVRPGQTTLSLTIDVAGLIGGYESSFTCVDGDPPRLVAFSLENFKAALLANVKLE